MDSSRTVIALNGAAFLLMLGVGLISPLLPGKIYDYSQSMVHVGGLASAFALSYVLVQVPMGMLADRYGFKQFIAAGYLFCAVAGSLYLLADSPITVLTGRMLQGLGEAPIWALSAALLSLINTNHKGKLLGWYNSSIHLGLTAGSLLSLLAFNTASMHNIFALYILLCIVAAIWVLVSASDSDRGDCDCAAVASNHEPDTLRRIFRDIRVMVVLAAIALYGLGYGVFITIIPSCIPHTWNMGVNLSGMIFVLFYTGIGLAQFLGGPLVDHKGSGLPMAAGLGIYSLAMVLFLSCSPMILLVLLFMASIGLGLFLVGSLSYLHDLVGRTAKGYISGLFYLVWGGGYLIGPLLLGYADRYDSAGQAFGAVGILGLGISCALYVLTRDNCL